MKKNANKGFSLVELIIVIAIMAVLIGVLAPQFIKQVENSRESTDLQNVEEMKTATETYVADHGDSIAAGTKYHVELTSTVVKADAPLTDYGIAAEGKAVKSKKWTAFKWTYDCDTYTWSVDNENKADTDKSVYDVYGNKK